MAEIDRTGSHRVPAADSVLNERMTQAVGTKTDSPGPFMVATASGMRYLKSLVSRGLLSLHGVCDAGMGASTVTIVCDDLAGFGDDYFNTRFWMKVLKNANAVGAAPEGQIRLITDYVSATGTFTVAAFTANVEASDIILILYESAAKESNKGTDELYDLINAELTLKETGGSLATDGTEQALWIVNAPAGLFKPIMVKVNLGNMIAGDSVTFKIYYRTVLAGGWEEYDPDIVRAGVQAKNLTITLDGVNRFGVRVTIQRTLGVDRAYPWEAFWED